MESGAQKKESGIASGKVAARELAELAESDIRICTITAAMPNGTGMDEF